ncbi:transporter [Xanthomonas euvesicatoria]|uniref:SphA family protein n=1 Tax=Xanthomonas citri TaxID=346 RepID=UPI002ED76263|nr:transporter [Xanthomonas euvesicatoria]
MYAPGIEGIFAPGGIPPPGWYGAIYGYSYSANKLRDGSGNEVPNDFKLDANVVVGRLLLVADRQILGGTLLAQLVLPLADTQVALDVAPGVRLRDSKFAQSDITVGAGLGYHYGQKAFGALGLDVFVPTGDYNVNELANTGRNYWAVATTYTFDYVDPAGFNFSTRLSYQLNFENPDTNYKSGQEFMVDYAAGWGLNNGWVLGLGGHIYQQTTLDEQNGQRLSGSKGRAFAIGPSLKYDSGKGWVVTAKYAPEFGVRNRADGAMFVIKAVMPL